MSKNKLHLIKEQTQVNVATQKLDMLLGDIRFVALAAFSAGVFYFFYYYWGPWGRVLSGG